MRRRARVLSVPLALILLVTLVPAGGGAVVEPVPRICLVCGERAIADALLNILLFLPLGIALGVIGAGAIAAVAAGAALSTVIELAQIWIPGRYTSGFDVASNSAGVLAGWLLAKSGSALWATPRRRRNLSRGALALPVLVVAATAFLLAPALPKAGAYYGQWTRVLPNSAVYDGRLTDTRIAGTAIAPPGFTTPAAVVRGPLLAGAPLIVEGVAGNRTPRYAPIFSIAATRGELLFIGADRDDAVFGYRTRAAALRLDQPTFRLAGAFRAPVPGAPLRIEMRRAGRGWCMQFDATRDCGFAHSIADGWAILMYPGWLPPAAQRVLGWLWLAAIVAPAGLLATMRLRPLLLRGLAIGGGIAAAALLASAVVVRAEDVAALAAGYVAAVLLRATLLRRMPLRQRSRPLVSGEQPAHLS